MPAIQMRLDKSAAVQPCKPAAGVARSASCTQPLDGRGDDLIGEVSSQPETPATQLAFVATQLAEQPGDSSAAGPASPAAPAAAPGSAMPPAQQAGDTAVGWTAATLQTAWVATEVQLEQAAQSPGTSPVAVQPASEPSPKGDATAPGAAAAAAAVASPAAAAAAPLPSAAPPNAATASGQAEELVAVPEPDAKEALVHAAAERMELCEGRELDNCTAAAAPEATQAPLALTAGPTTDAQPALQQHPTRSAPGGHASKQQAVMNSHTEPFEAAHTASQPACMGSMPGALASQHAPVTSTPAMAAAAAAAGTGPSATDAAPTSAEPRQASKTAVAVTTSPVPTGVGNGEPSQTQVLRHMHDSQALRGLLTQQAPGAAAAAAPAASAAPEAASLPPATQHVPANAAVSRLAADMHRADEQAGLSYVDACTTVAAVAEQQAISPKVWFYGLGAPASSSEMTAFSCEAACIETVPNLCSPCRQ